MSTTIPRRDLPDFFRELAKLAHTSRTRVHLHCTQPEDIGNRDAEWMHHCAGYVSDVRSDAVEKANPGDNTRQWLSFACINRITLHDIDGNLIRELNVTDPKGEAA